MTGFVVVRRNRPKWWLPQVFPLHKQCIETPENHELYGFWDSKRTQLGQEKKEKDSKLNRTRICFVTCLETFIGVELFWSLNNRPTNDVHTHTCGWSYRKYVDVLIREFRSGGRVNISGISRFATKMQDYLLIFLPIMMVYTFGNMLPGENRWWDPILWADLVKFLRVVVSVCHRFCHQFLINPLTGHCSSANASGNYWGNNR